MVAGSGAGSNSSEKYATGKAKKIINRRPNKLERLVVLIGIDFVSVPTLLVVGEEFDVPFPVFRWRIELIIDNDG